MLHVDPVVAEAVGSIGDIPGSLLPHVNLDLV
jgi:hypothetical protein